MNAWLGGRTLSPLHRDPYDGLLVQLIGRKEVRLVPPGAEGIYPCVRPQQNTSEVDAFAPDLERYPRFEARLSEGREASLEPGDALWVPKGWWHAVRATSAASFSVSFWWPSRVSKR